MKTSKHKYPRTFHLPWSMGIQSDDKVLKSLSHFIGKEVVLTEKMDGENTTLGPTYYHARSMDSQYNWTRSWIVNMHAMLKSELEEGIKFVGENLFAQHAIRYSDNELEGYFYLFSVWKDITENEDFCLDYDSTVTYADNFDLPMPKVLYKGIFDEKAFIKIAKELDSGKIEGYVLRTVEGFKRSDFGNHVAKYVRAGHVQPDAKHWLSNAVQNGKLKEEVKPFYMK